MEPSEKRPIERNLDTPEERDIARRRDALLADARGAADGKSSGDSSSSLAGLGLQFAIVILLCLYGGMWVDRKLGTAPWMLLAGVAAGASAGFYSMFRALKAGNDRADREGRH